MRLSTSIRTAITNAGGTPRSRSLRGLLQELVVAYGGTTFPDNDKVESLLKAAIVASGGSPNQTKFRKLLSQLVVQRGGTVTGLETVAQLGALLATSSSEPQVHTPSVTTPGLPAQPSRFTT